MLSGLMHSCTKKALMQQHEQQRPLWTERVFYNQYQTLGAQWTMTLVDANGLYLLELGLLFFAICGTETIRLLLFESGIAKKIDRRAAAAAFLVISTYSSGVEIQKPKRFCLYYCSAGINYCSLFVHRTIA